MNSLLDLKDLTKEYPAPSGKGKITVLDKVNLTIEPGGALGLIGESGAGKSALLRMIMGLERPSSGTVLFQDRQISLLTDKEKQSLKKEIQLIWQDPLSYLNPFMTVGQWIAEPLRVFSLGNRKDHPSRVRELADLTGLEKDCLRKRPHLLSGGQAQRAAIARALSLTPRLLLCDEILNGLDSLRQVQILDLLKKLQDETGLTVLFVSHDLAAVGYLCRRLAVLKDGKILEESTTNEFFQKPRHPYSVRLLEAAF